MRRPRLAYNTMRWRNILIILAVFITTTHADNATVDSSQKPEKSKLITERVDLNKTILEVEKILDKYPELPRIERSEILSILQNITEEDNEKLKVELTGVLEEEKQKMVESKSKQTTYVPKNTTRAENTRSVMVVMPFNANENEEDSLEELYTKSPVVVMEEQVIKVTTPAPKLDAVKKTTQAPTFSIVEKEDPSYNPPLRVIGYRYHTTPEPKLSSTERSYTNFQDPEQVTMAFRTQEVKVSYAWNHKVPQTTTEKLGDILFADIKPGTVWDDTPPARPTGFGQKFHVPDSMDNFSIEDAVSGELEEVKETSTVKNLDDFVFTTAPETTTPMMFITTKEPLRRKPTTTTEKISWSTTKPHLKKKKKTKPVEKPTVASVPQDLNNILNNLPPHMKEMLSGIGINDGTSFSQNSDNTEAPPIPVLRTASAPVDASSFYSFKPLPTKRQKVIADDMQTFLASFGLIDGNRQQKAVEESTTKAPMNDKFLETVPKINADFLSDTMRKTLDNLGLYDHVPAKEQSRKHIFNPKNHTSVQSTEEIKRLNTLLVTIKKLASLNDSDPVTPEFQREILQQVKDLDNITVSYKTSAAINEEIHKIMQRNKFKIPVVMKESSAESTLQAGLNPEFYEEIQLKNEVKRQENSTSSDSSTTTTTEPANSADLEDAFGGGETAPSSANPADSLPPKRPNGLYFLLDWNTFFEVGTEDDARRVNIRFQPKIGDGRNFLPVTIP